MNNTQTVAPSATHQLDVTAYHLAANAAAVTTLKLSVSFDGGSHWHALHVTATGAGGYTATYAVPALAQTDGSVSLRAQARDAAGDVISQTITDAYGIG